VVKPAHPAPHGLFHYTDTFHPRYLQYEDDIGQREVGQIADHQIELVPCVSPTDSARRPTRAPAGFWRSIFSGTWCRDFDTPAPHSKPGHGRAGNARVRPAEHRLGQPPCVLHLHQPAGGKYRRQRSSESTRRVISSRGTRPGKNRHELSRGRFRRYGISPRRFAADLSSHSGRCLVSRRIQPLPGGIKRKRGD